MTNIVNGHASNAEQEAPGHTTRARDVDTFVKEVAIEAIPFPRKELLELFKQEKNQSTSESDKKIDPCRIRFIKINVALRSFAGKTEEEKNSYIFDSARGTWHIDENKQPKYVVVLNGQQVLAAYEIVGGWKPFRELRIDEPKEIRKNDKLIQESLRLPDCYNAYCRLCDDEKLTSVDEKRYGNIINRWGFDEVIEITKEAASDENAPEIHRILGKLIGCLLSDRYFVGQYDMSFTPSNNATWDRCEYRYLAERFFETIDPNKKVEHHFSNEDIAILGDQNRLCAKFQEFSSVCGIKPYESKDKRKLIWKWNEREYFLGKNSTEEDFHKRLFVEWFIDEKMSKKK